MMSVARRGSSLSPLVSELDIKGDYVRGGSAPVAVVVCGKVRKANDEVEQERRRKTGKPY